MIVAVVVLVTKVSQNKVKVEAHRYIYMAKLDKVAKGLFVHQHTHSKAGP
jgi:hypothetical protein